MLALFECSLSLDPTVENPQVQNQIVSFKPVLVAMTVVPNDCKLFLSGARFHSIIVSI